MWSACVWDHHKYLWVTTSLFSKCEPLFCMCRCASRANSWPSPLQRLLFIRFLSCPGGALWCFCVRRPPWTSVRSVIQIIFDITLGATKRPVGAGFNKWSAVRQQRHTSPSFVSRLTLSLKNNTWTDVREEFGSLGARHSLALRLKAQDNKWSHAGEQGSRFILRARVSSPGLSAPTSNWRPF